MPLTIRDAHNRRGAVIHGSGDVTPGEIKACNVAFYARQDFEAMRWQLWCFPASIAPKATSNDMREIALQGIEAVRRNPGCLVALVLESPALLALGRLYEVYSSVWSGGLTVGVFDNPGAARDWLRKKAPDLPWQEDAFCIAGEGPGLTPEV